MLETRVGQPRVGEDMQAYSREMERVFGEEWSKPWWEKRDERAAMTKLPRAVVVVEDPAGGEVVEIQMRTELRELPYMDRFMKGLN